MPTTKLTMITINGRTLFVPCVCDPTGKVRVSMDSLLAAFGLGRGDCIRFGS